MSNTFLSASSIPGGLLPSPSANLFERSIGTLLSTFKYSVADPVGTNANNVRTYQPYQSHQPPQTQYQYSQPASVNNINMVMGQTGPVANSNVIPVSGAANKSVKKTTLYGEMMAVKLEKENKSGASLTVPSTTSYTNITLNPPNQTLKPPEAAPKAASTTNTFQIPQPIQQPGAAVNTPQITLQSNYPPPPPPAPQVIQINAQNNQQAPSNYQNVTVQGPVTNTFQNISYQQPANNGNSGQTIYQSSIQIPSMPQNNSNFQSSAQSQVQSSSVSNVSNSSSSQQVSSQKMEENANLLSNHLQQNYTPTLNYIVGCFMDSIDSMPQNIDFFQSGNNTYTKNSDSNSSGQKINYHPNMLTLFNDRLIDENSNKPYVVNYNNGKDESKLINEYFNWDDLLSDTEKPQSIGLYNNVVSSQTLNQGQTQTIQLPSQNIQPITITNQAQPQIQQQTITVPTQSQQNPPFQFASQQYQQVNVQTPQLRSQTIQSNAPSQQRVVVMVDSGTNYQTSIYPQQNSINQNFVAQPAGTNFNNQTGQIQTQINYTNNIVTQSQTQGSIAANTAEQPQGSQSLMFKGDTQDITRMTRVENTSNNSNNSNTSNSNNIQFYQGFDGSNNSTIQNIQPSNVQFTNPPTIYSNSANGTSLNDNSQLQDTKLINKSLDNLNSSSISVNTNGTLSDITNSNNNTLDGISTDNATTGQQSITTKPKRKERPSTKPKPFKCPTCQQTFSRSHDLKRHIYTHTGIKPFKCEKCGKSFSRRDALNRHSRGEINCIRYLNKLNNMKKQQNKAKPQDGKVQ